MLSPSTLFLFILMPLLLLVNFSIEDALPKPPKFTNWETGMLVTDWTDWEKLRVYTNQQGQININGWVQNKKPVSFPLFFKNPKQSAGGPKNPLYFDMKICPAPGKRCSNGFILCFVGQLDPDNNGVSRTFELKNPDNNPIGKICNEPGIWKNWKGMEEGKKNKRMHGLQIQPEAGGIWDVSASYCKVEENENSKSDFRMKREVRLGGGCSILRFNTDSSIGGSWVPRVGGMVKDMSNGFRSKVHNGAMLDQQNAMFSLPLDVLSKFNPANDLFGIVGSQDCGITITFEGDNLKRCIKPEDCPHNLAPTECKVHYQEAIPATIKDKMQHPAGARFKRGLLESDGPEARYVRVGFLKKPKENSEHKHDFDALIGAVFNDAIKNRTVQLNQAKLTPYIKDLLLLTGSRTRTLGATAVFDYWKLDEAIKEPVMKVVKCTDGSEMSADVFDKGQKPPTPRMNKLNFSGDFDRFEDCCMRPVVVGKSDALPLDKIKEGGDWPDAFKFKALPVKIGLNQSTLKPEEKMAALFKYSLSPFAHRDHAFGRGNYLSIGAADPKGFTYGHLFGPPELAIRMQENYTVKVDLRPKPKMGELDKWNVDGKTVMLVMEQPVVQCGCSGAPPKDGQAEHLQMRLPILVVFPTKELPNGNFERIEHATLEGQFTVGEGPTKLVTEGRRKAYYEGWWNNMLMAKEQKQMEMNMGQLNKKKATMGEDDERVEDDGDQVDREDDYDDDDEEEDEY